MCAPGYFRSVTTVSRYELECEESLMSRIDLVSKNLLANCFRNFSKKRFKENCYQKSIEEIANVAKIAKVRRIFLAM